MAQAVCRRSRSAIAAQRREIVGDDPPDDFGIDTPIFVADQVAERTPVRPADIWLRRQKLFGQMPNRLRNDFKSPLHPELEKHVGLEARLRSPVDSPVDNFDRGEYPRERRRCGAPSKHAHGVPLDLAAQLGMQAFSRGHIDLAPDRLVQQAVHAGQIK